MPRFMLNPKKANNYAFFCPQSRLHLTASSPVGSANEVTSAIIRGVKSQAIIDLDGVIGSQQKAENKAASAETAVVHTEEKPTETPKAEEKPKRNSRKKAAAPEEKTEQQAAENAAE